MWALRFGLRVLVVMSFMTSFVRPVPVTEKQMNEQVSTMDGQLPDGGSHPLVKVDSNWPKHRNDDDHEDDNDAASRTTWTRSAQLVKREQHQKFQKCGSNLARLVENFCYLQMKCFVRGRRSLDYAARMKRNIVETCCTKPCDTRALKQFCLCP